LVYSAFVSDLIVNRMFFLDDPIKQRTTLVYRKSETNVEYAKIDRMLFLDDPIKQRTTLVYTRSETNVEYTKLVLFSV
jgi:hypothetical protein